MSAAALSVMAYAFVAIGGAVLATIVLGLVYLVITEVPELAIAILGIVLIVGFFWGMDHLGLW